MSSDRIHRALNRLSARLSTRARPATGFTSAPEPRLVGHFARGRQLIAGNYLFPGDLIEAKGRTLWDAAEATGKPPRRSAGTGVRLA